MSTLMYHYERQEYHTQEPEAALRGLLDGTWGLVHTDPALSYFYAASEVYGPWPPGEAAIAQSAEWSLRYSSTVIRGAWAPGEAAIAQEPLWATIYALEVIKGRWPPGEAAIFKIKELREAYIRQVGCLSATQPG